MTTSADRMAVLMDGPPPRVPERVTEDSQTVGRRVLVNTSFVDETREDWHEQWARDLRAVDNPYWYDEQTHKRWLPGPLNVPDDADPDRARLFVSVCTERDWYDWARTKRRPEVREYPAYLVWVE